MCHYCFSGAAARRADAIIDSYKSEIENEFWKDVNEKQAAADAERAAEERKSEWTRTTSEAARKAARKGLKVKYTYFGGKERYINHREILDLINSETYIDGEKRFAIHNCKLISEMLYNLYNEVIEAATPGMRISIGIKDDETGLYAATVTRGTMDPNAFIYLYSENYLETDDYGPDEIFQQWKDHEIPNILYRLQGAERATNAGAEEILPNNWITE
jgi:hypothetical protein